MRTTKCSLRTATLDRLLSLIGDTSWPGSYGLIGYLCWSVKCWADKAFTLKGNICLLPDFLCMCDKRPAMWFDVTNSEMYVCMCHLKTNRPPLPLGSLTCSCCPMCDNHEIGSCAGRSGEQQCQRQQCRLHPRPRHHKLWCSHVRRPPPAVTESHASDGAGTMTGHWPLQRGGSGNRGYWGIGEKLEKEWWTRGQKSWGK